MNLTPAIKNFLYYFKPTKSPLIWTIGVDEGYARVAALGIYTGELDWLDTDVRIVDVLKGKDIVVKKLAVDFLLADMNVVAPSGIDKFLEKTKMLVSRNGDEQEVKTFFKSKGFTLVDESEGQLTWVHS